MTYIATLSFGKDSTTMVDLLCKNNYPLDYIVFSDTLMEFPMMYEYALKVTDYFKRKYNKEVIITKPMTTFEEWCFGVIRKECAHKGNIRGIPLVTDGVCFWRREAKIKPFDALMKEKGIKKYKTYIGYTLDEKNRKQKDPNLLYPLIDYFKMNEDDCKKYLIDEDMENPLYRHFTRTGCAMCPFQDDRAWYEVWKNFPEVWDYCKWIEKRLFQYEKLGLSVANKWWFSKYRTCEDMEYKFKNTANKMFLDDEPLRDCFCKI